MCIFEEMRPSGRLTEPWEFNELKRMLGEAIERGFVEPIPAPLPGVSWYRERETEEIYALEGPGDKGGYWSRVDMASFDLATDVPQ